MIEHVSLSLREIRGGTVTIEVVKRKASRLRRLTGNALSLLTSDVLNRATSFVIYALVARQLGSVAVGQVSLAFTLFYVFRVLAVAGLKTLIVREVAKNRQDTERYIVNAPLAVLLYGLVSVALMGAFVLIMGYRSETAAVILLLSLGLIPYAMTAVNEAIFQAWERMHLIAYANAPMNVLKIGLVVVVLALGYGVKELMIIVLLAHFATAGFEWWLMLRYIMRPRIQFDLGFAYAISRRAVTFLGIDIAIAVRSAIPVLLLSKLLSERAVGLFSAAQQPLIPMALVYMALAWTVFPVLCRKFSTGLSDFSHVGHRLIEVMMVLALPAAVGLFLLSDSVLLVLYADVDFLNATVVLRILVWGTILRATTAALGQILIAANCERMTLRITLVNIAVLLVLGIVLINAMGLTGAAVAMVGTRLMNLILHMVFVWKVLPAFNPIRRMWIPGIACVAMWGILELVTQYNLAFQVLSGAFVYALALSAVILVLNGGPRETKKRYMQLWSGS